MWATTMRSGRKHDDRDLDRASVIVEPDEGPTTTRHDFGHGEVRARRHRNPDRTLGGWVAETAHADSEAVVATDAVVFGNARVFGPCLILGRARVFDFARVSGGSVVSDDGEVSESAIVTDGVVAEWAVVAGSARVQGGVVRGTALVTDGARVNSGAVVQDRAEVRGLAFVTDGAVVTGDTIVEGAVRGDVIVLDARLDAEEDVVPADAAAAGPYVAEHVDLLGGDELIEPDEDVSAF